MPFAPCAPRAPRLRPLRPLRLLDRCANYALCALCALRASYVERYKRGESLEAIAKAVQLPPTMLARFVLEQHLELKKGKEVGLFLKEPHRTAQQADVSADYDSSSPSQAAQRAMNTKSCERPRRQATVGRASAILEVAVTREGRERGEAGGSEAQGEGGTERRATGPATLRGSA